MIQRAIGFGISCNGGWIGLASQQRGMTGFMSSEIAFRLQKNISKTLIYLNRKLLSENN